MVTAITNIQWNLDADEFLRVEGAAFNRPEAKEMVKSVISEARVLMTPALVFDWFSVRKVGGEDVEIGGVGFHLGRHAFLLDTAVEACVCVATIGRLLEERVAQLMCTGEGFRGYVLDEIGVFGLAMGAGRYIRELAQIEGERRGWGVGADLGPGRLPDWDVAEQMLICRLVDVDEIGVAVTESGMLVPRKSVSVVVGIGPDLTADKVHPPCDFCWRSDTCTWVQDEARLSI